MKIFSWMQNKLNGKQIPTKPNSTHHMLNEPCKEEFSDWPDGLLAIGTLGINNLKNSPEKSYLEGSLAFSRNQPEDIIVERLTGSHNSYDAFDASTECNSLPETFTVCMQSMQDGANCDNSRKDEFHLQPSTSLARHRGMDLCLDNTKLDIQKKSFSSILKKTFTCGGDEISPPPVIKNPFPEPKSEKSRMKKILRTLLHQKIYPRSPSPRGVGKKHLNNKTVPERDSDDEASEKASNRCKWVKTDSEYIVLEI